MSRVKKLCLKSSKNGKNIDFLEKFLTVTDIYFYFMGGYHSTFSRKIGPNLGKMHFLVKHSAIRGTEKQYRGVFFVVKLDFLGVKLCSL